VSVIYTAILVEGELTRENSYGDIPAEPIKPHVTFCKSAMEACKNAEAIVVCTEWDEFKTLDWEASGSFLSLTSRG